MSILTYSTLNNWGTGLVGQVEIAAGTMPLTQWQASFAASFTITSIWGAEIVSYVDGIYTVRGAWWNADMAAGAVSSFGFVGIGAPGLGGLGFVGAQPEPPVAAVAAAGAAEGGEALFTISLSSASATAVTLGWSTADGTALAGQDYLAAAGSVTFAPGETSKTIRVSLLDDARHEGAEAFSLVLSAPAGATLGTAQAQAAIADDDAPPVLAAAAGAASESAGQALFTVSLSAASALPVTVGWATAAGTAQAGADFTAASGTLTFAPGETSKAVAVAVAQDSLVEAGETLSLVLSGAQGATVGAGSATATVLDDDVAPPPAGDLPAASVGDAQVLEGHGGGGTPGFFSTSGNQIVDASGTPVRIAAVSWFGMENELGVPHGLWTRNWQEMMAEIKAQGFNTIRLPFSSDSLDNASISGVDTGLNPDLAGLTPLQVMDKVVAEAGELGLRIILDRHVATNGVGVPGNGFWFDGNVSEAKWIADWQMLAGRYAGNATVIGADLHNEPWGATWGGGGATDWHRAATAAGNAIQAVNPDWLIIVEGVAVAKGDAYWWGGNLQGVRDLPVVLNIPNKVVYSPHDYPNSIYPADWFSGAGWEDRLAGIFDENWGYIFREEIAPIWLGEFGTRMTDPKDLLWLDAITAYLDGDLDTDGDSDLAPGDLGMSWAWWSWNPNSTDTGGILADDWRTVNANKVAILQPMMAVLPPADGPAGAPVDAATLSFTVTLDAASTQSVTLGWRAVAGTAGAGDFTAAAGSLVFAPGEVSKVVEVTVTGDRLAEADETVLLELTNAQGATLARAIGTGTILNDDGAVVAPPPPPPPPPPPTPAALAGSVRVTSDWGSGYVAEVTVTNTGGAAVNGWSFRLDVDDAVTSLWNGTLGARDAQGDFLVTNAGWNASIAAGASVTVGFQAAGPSSGALDVLFG